MVLKHYKYHTIAHLEQASPDAYPPVLRQRIVSRPSARFTSAERLASTNPFYVSDASAVRRVHSYSRSTSTEHLASTRPFYVSGTLDARRMNTRHFYRGGPNVPQGFLDKRHYKWKIPFGAALGLTPA